MARIFPKRMYFRKVGFEILRKEVASFVVKTVSFSQKAMTFLQFFSVFGCYQQDICQLEGKTILS